MYNTEQHISYSGTCLNDVELWLVLSCARLDYCGIALLTIGSFVPWLYYSFYCRMSPKIGYLALIALLGTFSIIVSMCDRFSRPHFRPLRAGLYFLSVSHSMSVFIH